MSQRKWLRRAFCHLDRRCLIGLLTVPLLLAPGGHAGTAEAEADRDAVLGRLARIASLYRDNVLRFSAEEAIHYHAHTGRKSWRFDYVYRHDPQQGLQDFRLRHRDGERKQIKPKDIVEPNDIPVPAMLLRAYSWIFIFEPAQQQRFRFEMHGGDEALGRPAWRIRFAGTPPFIDANRWVGWAWVDVETSQLLRVEARRPEDHEVWQGYERALEALDAGKRARTTFHSFETVTTEFTEEKNGMRFPGEVRLERREFEVPDHARTGRLVYLVRQEYGNYRFFSVRTREEIRAVSDDP